MAAMTAVAMLTIGGCGDATRSDGAGVSTSALTSPTTAADTTGSVPTGPVSSFERVPAPSLASNVLGDPAELEVAVWLPPSYATSLDRYPVVYFLDGYGESASTSVLGRVLEELVDDGSAPAMILVALDGDNALGGSFYVDSPVTGNWSAAIHTDLVGWVDSTYRTLATPASRGIAGFSMGGFGALDLAMRHPDVFGSVYALSPGLFAPGGLEQTVMFEPDTVAEFIALQQADVDDANELTGSASLRFAVAYGSAFAPDLDRGFPYVAHPFAGVDAARDEVIWASWEAGYGGIDAEVAEFADNLRALRGIALDYGIHDRYEWIPEGTRYFADRLSEIGVTASVTTYDGGHGPVGPRAEAVMFPFFASVLDVAS